jgi:excisionase family DNA binding protein
MNNPFETLTERLDRIENLLENLSQAEKSVEVPEEILTIEQASEFLNLSKNTLYGYVQKSKIPVSKKGKRLYFSKLELLDWVKSGKKQSQSEIDNEVDSFLSAQTSKK